ncbi:MAG: phospholipid-binding protein [Cyanothece sp. SIO1E1]|nr:phospholipid-binding protein [Cyanothece sp. SIO1E1]
MGVLESSLSLADQPLTDQLNRQPYRRHLSSSTLFYPLFRTIPPERIGLNNEYDHNGLAKRVKLAFIQAFSPGEVADLRITQRGRVVILLGEVTSQERLNELVNVALQVEGSACVETDGVNITACALTLK